MSVGGISNRVGYLRCKRMENRARASKAFKAQDQNVSISKQLDDLRGTGIVDSQRRAGQGTRGVGECFAL